MEHPKCADCGKFIKWAQTKFKRVWSGHPNVGCDDIQIGVCQSCEQ